MSRNKEIVSICIVLMTLFSCHKDKVYSEKIKSYFSIEEEKIISISKSIINDCYYATFITVDKTGQPRARVMEPFTPDENFIIWMATNPRSRKVRQLQKKFKGYFALL